jgi:enoyl-CoA hydratase/carnithine racemase
MPSDQLLVDVSDHVATVTFNRPKKMNAATVDMGEALVEAFEEIEDNDDVRVVVLTGAGDRAFCAGDDVQEAWNDPRTEQIMRKLGGIRPPMTPESTIVLGCSKPTIAAVNGLALGIGMDFAVMCDLRIASENASFALLYVKMGLMADLPTYWRLPQLVGYEKATELAFTGDFVDAREAERIGLVSKVVAPDELMPGVYDLAGKIAANPPLAVRHIKEGFRRAAGRSYTDLADVATFVGNGLARLFETKDHKEAAAAFLEKRAPVFEGH